jgi:photosystem II stability/assembly factor-like uncharacterized protein
VALPGGVLLAGGLRGSLYRSADDGLTWARVDTGSKSSVTAMAAQPGAVVAVGLDGLVLRSSDGGASFTNEVRADRASLTSVTIEPNGRTVYFSRHGALGDAAPSGAN